MKPAISAADVKNLRLALSHFASAREWFALAQLFGIDLREQIERVDANEKIANDALAQLEPRKGEMA